MEEKKEQKSARECRSAGSEGDGADKENLVKLGRELHSLAAYETFAWIFTSVGCLLGKLRRGGMWVGILVACCNFIG